MRNQGIMQVSRAHGDFLSFPKTAICSFRNESVGVRWVFNLGETPGGSQLTHPAAAADFYAHADTPLRLNLSEKE